MEPPYLSWVLPHKLLWPKEFGQLLKGSPVAASTYTVVGGVISSVLTALLDRLFGGGYENPQIMVSTIVFDMLLGGTLFVGYGAAFHFFLGRRGGTGSFGATLGCTGYGIVPLAWALAVWLLLVTAFGGNQPIQLSIYLHQAWLATAAVIGLGLLWGFWILVETMSEVHTLPPGETAWTTVYTLLLVSLGTSFCILALRGYPIPEPPRAPD